MLEQCSINPAEMKILAANRNIEGHYAVGPLKGLKLAELKSRYFPGKNVRISWCVDHHQVSAINVQPVKCISVWSSHPSHQHNVINQRFLQFLFFLFV